MTIDRRSLLVAGLVLPAAPVLARGDMTRLTIVTRAGVRHPFQLEIANTPESRSRGLMFRRELAPDRGMLFEFGARETEISMWMKNTYIPLDMLFILEDGKIAAIAENTTPLSEQSVNPGVPVIAVLELAGGFSGRHGVAAGDRFRLLD